MKMVIFISGKKHYLWRAVDHDGYVLDEIIQTRRNTKAAKRLLMRLLKQQGLPPKRIVTDKLRSMVQRSGRSCPMSNTALTKG